MNTTQQYAACFAFTSVLFAACLTGRTAPGGEKIDYGADQVNSLAPTAGAKLGGGGDYDCLALRDHIGPSGVPVGGIGVGCFDYAPDGAFTRLCINNWHADGPASVIHDAPGTFLATWTPDGARLLRRAERGYAGMAPARHTVYRGLFPIAENRVDDLANVRVWSGLVPQNVKDSSLPLAWVEVTLSNPAAAARPVAVAFSWQDILAREIVDIREPELLKSFGASAWEHNKAISGSERHGQSGWSRLPRVATKATPFSAAGFSGIRQHCPPLEPMLKTYQNYNNEVAIAAEQAPGIEITTLPAYAVDAPDAAWKSFCTEGRFPAAGEAPLFDPDAKQEHASAIAVRATLQAGESRTVRFVVAWFAPELKIDPARDLPGSWFGAADYNRHYHNSFQNISALIAYAGAQRERILAQTQTWQAPILNSTYPDWLKFKAINSAYTLYTNTILNKAGDFTVMEGGMGGLAGTMDQRISAHPFYFKFFTALDRSDLELFGHTPGSHGQILHFDGHYYFGLNSRDGHTPVPENSMVDNTGGWLLQLAKDYQQSGDRQWLEQFRDQIPRSLAYLRRCIKSKQFQIPTGPTTYDDFWHPEIYAYNASTYPAFLRAGAVLLDALGDRAGAAECRSQALVSARDALRALWNGRFLSYGADLDGSHRRDDILFSGQLAGQFLSRYCGWGDVFPLDVTQAAVVAQLKTNIAHSADFYAPKVWLVKEGKAMIDPRRPNDPNADSTCWPFYLESYTAMAAVQAGYVEDGLAIIKHIQLVNLRNGWTWTQNLWRPGELTYVCAPVSWFITDVLAGSGVDVPGNVLHLAPVLRADRLTALPVFFPRFWAMLEADRDRRQLAFRVLKVFDGPEIVIKQVVFNPVGAATSRHRQFDVPPFTVRPGAVLDLSSHWADLTASSPRPAVLPQADKVPFLEVGTLNAQ